MKVTSAVAAAANAAIVAEAKAAAFTIISLILLPEAVVRENRVGRSES